MMVKSMTSSPALNSLQFNLREVAKQMLLVEDHLSIPDKTCTDCIQKHLLLIEAYAEEAITLGGTDSELRMVHGLVSLAKYWMGLFNKGYNYPKLSQQIRRERKKLVEIAYGHAPVKAKKK